MDQKRTLHPALAALIVIVLIGIVASVVITVNANKDTTDISGANTTPTTTADTAETESTDTATYTDGTYSATGTYLSPGGRESIELTVTIKDGVITDTALVTNASDAEAEEYQTLFSKNYKDLVVGKKVNGLNLSRVAGSSLTSNGFNNALDEIRNDAKA